MDLDAQWIWTFLLLFARASALAAVAPIFGSKGVPAPIRLGLALALSLGLTPMLIDAVGPHPDNLIAIGAGVVQSALVGIALGYTATLIISAAEMAGQWLDTQIGFGMIHQINPFTNFPSSLLAQFHYLLALTIFAISDGHHILMAGLVRSFEFGSAPTATALAHSAMSGAATLLTQAIMLAAQIAAPAIGALFITDAAMAAVSRAVPQIPVWIVGMPAKILIGLSAVAVALPALLWGSQRIIALIAESLAGLARLL